LRRLGGIAFQRHQGLAQIGEIRGQRRREIRLMVRQPDHRRRGQRRIVPGQCGRRPRGVDVAGALRARDCIGGAAPAIHRVADIATKPLERGKRPPA